MFTKALKEFEEACKMIEDARIPDLQPMESLKERVKELRIRHSYHVQNNSIQAEIVLIDIEAIEKEIKERESN